MPQGYAVRVMTKQMDGSRPLMVLYAVVLESENDALAAVRNKTGPDEDVAVVAPLSAATVQALRLAPGQISMLS
jgi:hypothetical protein